MSGHSKWANIRFRKSLQDTKRGKIFTKLIREISNAAKLGGACEDTNPRLRDAVNKALKANMKRDTIDNAIKRGIGNLEGSNMVEMRYEGYGPGGVAILVDCLSENKNRTVSDVRHAFTKCKGHLGAEGSVAYLFIERGEILLSKDTPEDKLMEVAIEAGAQDIIIGEQVIVITGVDEYHHVLKTLEHSGFQVEQSHLTMHPQNFIQLDAVNTELLIKLIDMLEDLDDVQEVYFNADLLDNSEFSAQTE